MPMRSKLSLILLLFTTFTIFAVTFLNLSQGPSTFRGFQTSNKPNQKQNSRSAENDSTNDLQNLVGLSNSEKVEDFETRRLQDTSSTDNTTASTDDSSSSIGDDPSDSDSTETVAGSDPNSTSPAAPETSPLYSVNPTQIAHSEKISGAVYFGIKKIIDIGVLQRNIPPLVLDYNVTKYIRTTYRRYSNHAVYMFKTKLANSNLKRVDANFTVYYNYTTKGYSLLYYSYHAYNYTKAELYPNIIANDTNNTNITQPDTTAQTEPDSTEITLDQINNDPQTLNGLLYGIQSLVKTGINQGQVPINCNDFSLNNLVNAGYLNQSTGVRYWFSTNLAENDGDLGLEANFTISFSESTQKYRLASYSYIARNLTLPDDGNNGSSDSDYSDPGENTNSTTPPIDNGSGNGDNSTTNETLPGNGTNNTDPSTPPIDNNSTNSTNPTNPDGNGNNSTNNTDPTIPTDPTSPETDNSDIGEESVIGEVSPIEDGSDVGEESDVGETSPTPIEDGSDTGETSPAPTEDDSDIEEESDAGETSPIPTEEDSDVSDPTEIEEIGENESSSNEMELENEFNGKGITVKADIKTEEKPGSFDLKVHITFP